LVIEKEPNPIQEIPAGLAGHEHSTGSQEETVMQRICFTLFSIILLMLIQVTSAEAYEMEIEQLSNTIAKQISKSSRKHLQRVAVVDFTDLQGNVTELGRFIAEELSINLARSEKQFEIIDRTHLKSLLEEHKFSMSGLVDPQKAKKIGKIAGVDAIVTGKLTPFGDNVRVSCTVISTTTAKTLAAGKTSIAKTRTIEQLLAGSSAGQTGPAERDQEQDLAERQRRARDAEREKLDQESAALDKLKEEQKKLDAERLNLEEERRKQDKSAKDSEQMEKIQEEQKKLEAERLRIEEERKKLAGSAKKSTPSPIKRGYKPIATQETEDIIFDLTGAKVSGDEITIYIEIINKSDNEKSIALYDESHGSWAKSRITDDMNRATAVTKVFFWKGDQKTSMQATGRYGINVDPKSAISAQLNFRKTRTGLKSLNTLILHPFIYSRIAFVRPWTEPELTFHNIRLTRGK
jgi:TolB-like protein